MKTPLRLFLHPVAISLFVVLGLAAAAAGGKWIAWPLYKDWREARWMAMAEEFYEDEEHEAAMDLLRKVLHQNPISVEAWRLAERISRARDSRELPYVLSQLLALKEDDVEIRLEMAEQALRHGAYEPALEVLRSVDEEGMKTARFHQLAASVALAREQFGSAAYHLQEMERLNPGDNSTRLALASVRLRHPEQAVRHESAEIIRSLTEDPDLRYQALRTLLTRAILEKDAEEGLRVIEAIRAEETDPPFSDRLLLLEAVQIFAPEKFETLRVELQSLAGENIEMISALGRFLIQRENYREAREWLESLPLRVRNAQPVITLLLDAVSRLEDLPALADYLQIEWERNDHYRLAVRARTLRSLGQPREAREAWQRATIVAASNPEHMRGLYTQARQWGWVEEKIVLLDRIFRNNPHEDWAFQELVGHYYQQQNTSELVRLFSRRMEYQTDNRTISNNFALLCLLQNIHRGRAHGLALENYTEEPGDPYFTTTYAFSLHNQGQTAEALQILETLDEEKLRDGSRNLYYAIILAANGRLRDAEIHLANLRADELLPEERDLKAHTRSLISGSGRP